MSKKTFFLFFLLLLFGCSNEKEFNTIQKPEVNTMNIGIVGEIPTHIKEKNIKFEEITLQNLNQKAENSFDAIMITKDYLQEASSEKYTEFYLNSSIPIIFIQSDKAISAFIIPGHTYEDTFENYAKDYFIGYYKGTNFGITLNGDTDEDLTKGYSSLFALLNKFKQTSNQTK